MKNHGYLHDSSSFHSREAKRIKGVVKPQKRFPIRFIACLAAITGVTVFAMFCFTVQSFPGGGMRVEVPGGFRVEAQLGNPPPLVQSISTDNSK